MKEGPALTAQRSQTLPCASVSPLADTFSVPARGSPSSLRVTGGCQGCRIPAELPATITSCDDQLTQDFPLVLSTGWQSHSSENHQGSRELPQPFWLITASPSPVSQQDVWRRRCSLESQGRTQGSQAGGDRGYRGFGFLLY